ncbi:MAG TPA: acyl-CoA thioesterase [Candidatus Bacteroides merdipullorum]|uniref:Acyl-CoA thioesterase n=1 Tax=Candidatus Bacteroides merdipullorum TaxID=2838474 RepID=A0A9D2A7K0_9BACE|nr:acyl-CoA thioesterase [Candidatus Bacteroides merdipullorum]
MKLLEDICRIRVKFGETDAMGCVWHGSYVSYLEDGRESFGRRYPGIGYADISRSGIYAPVYDLHVRYLSPLGLDDVAEVHTRYVCKPGARLDFSYEIYRERDGVLCCTADTTQLFIDPRGELLTEKPDYYARWQARFLED